MTPKPNKPLPRYMPTKEVRAVKIANILAIMEGGGAAMITPAEPGYEPFYVDGTYMQRHKPQRGGYFVEYNDNTKAYIPQKVFEEGYSRVEEKTPVIAKPPGSDAPSESSGGGTGAHARPVLSGQAARTGP